MAEVECTEKDSLQKNQAEMLKIQQQITNSKARAKVYGKHDAKSIDDRTQLSDHKIGLAQRYQPRKTVESSL